MIPLISMETTKEESTLELPSFLLVTLRWVEGIPALRSLSGSKNEDSCLTAGAGFEPAPNSGVDEGPKCIFLLGGERPNPAASNCRREACSMTLAVASSMALWDASIWF